MSALIIRFSGVTSLLTGWLVLFALLFASSVSSTYANSVRLDKSLQPSAVILMYHRFGEGGFPSTNTTLEQLDDHISALQEGGYTVVPLNQVVKALQGTAELPYKAVAITVDDAYRSFRNVAWPKFKSAGFPVTLFVATEGVEQRYRNLLTWENIRDLQSEGVDIGAHSHSHAHYPSLSKEAVAQDLKAMASAFEVALGDIPNLFAFPYGEAGLSDMAAVQDAGFDAAFGQHSGAVGEYSDLKYLPRFALNENFGGPERFRLVINTLPLAVTEVTPPDPVLKANRPTLMFTVGSAPSNLNSVTCFGPFGVNVVTEVQDSRIQVRPDRDFPTGRVRVNCTLQSTVPATAGRWHWFGWQMISGFETERVPVHERFR